MYDAEPYHQPDYDKVSRIMSNNSIHNNPLRFGIVCDQIDVALWQANCIQSLIDSEHAEAVVLIRCDQNPKQKPPFFWRLYFSHRVTKIAKNLTRVSILEKLSGLPKIEVKLDNIDKYSRTFSADDIDQLNAYNLDFLLWFSSGILKGKILTLPRYGVWSYHHGDPSKYRGSPAYFWEIYDNDPVTVTVLQQLTEDLDERPILQQGKFRTGKQSYIGNLDVIYHNISNWPEKVCARLRLGGEFHLTSNITKKSNKYKLYKNPTNLQLIYFFTRQLKSVVHRFFFKLLVTDYWHVGIVNEPINKFLDADFEPEIDWLPRKKSASYIADPFGYKKDDQETILVEKFDFRSHKGILVAYSSTDGKVFNNEQVVLDLPYHLSYPYLIEHDDEIYCLPECHQSGKLTLYHAIDFPGEWEKVVTIIKNFPAVDATIIQHDNMWWLFCTNESNLNCSGLYIWYASDLTGDWKQHALNPVKIDIQNSRPAGSPFILEENIYRPTQDCSESYGSAIHINQLMRLSPHEFEEETVRILKPNPRSTYAKGLHHLSPIGERTLVDGKRYIFSFNHSLNRLLSGFFRK